MLRRLPQIAALSLAFIAAAVACSSSDDAEPTPTNTPVAVESYGERGQYRVGVTTLTLVDPSRPTAANGDFAGAPDRTLQVEVWYPGLVAADGPNARDVPVDKDRGPYPLIVFAHGFSSQRLQSVQYTEHLASRGYVVVSPDFPSSRGGAPGGPRLRGVIDQPGDVSFILDELQARDSEPDWRFAGAIDFARIGMTGHSLGGLTTLMTVYGPMRDDRVIAALPISPPGCFLEEDVIGDVTTPIMVLGGSEELIVDPSSIRRSYDVANPPRYFVELGGADHIKFADVNINDRDIGGTDVVTRITGGNLVPDAIAIAESIGGGVGTCVTRDGPKGKEYITGDRQRELLRLFGALFFDAYLRNDEGALALLRGGDLTTVAPEAFVEYE